MATQSIPERRMTVAEYVAFELASPERHEYHDGDVIAMSGASRAHNRIAGNIYSRLLRASLDGSCRPSIEGVRLVLGPGSQYYPDVMVACGPPPDDPRIETAPCVIVEVLSPSTRGVDIAVKSPRYRELASLKLLLLVRQDERILSAFERADDGRWVVSDYIGNGAVTFPCPGAPGGPVTMTFDEIYEGAEPPPDPDAA